jgi:hypothetical protein
MTVSVPGELHPQHIALASCPDQYPLLYPDFVGPRGTQRVRQRHILEYFSSRIAAECGAAHGLNARARPFFEQFNAVQKLLP